MNKHRFVNELSVSFHFTVALGLLKNQMIGVRVCYILYLGLSQMFCKNILYLHTECYSTNVLIV